MGLQIRKRTKGKNSWFNFSASKKNGLGASMSVKLGKNVTYNTRGRVTVNFGNGIRYVAYKKKKRKETVVKPPKEPRTRSRARSSNKTYTYTPVQYTREEILQSCQKVVFDIGTHGLFTEHAELSVIVDLHNAIDFLYESPISLETRDLIIVTSNLFVDMVKEKNDAEAMRQATIVNNYLRSILPDRPKPTPKVKEETNYGWWIAGAVTLLILLKSCT